MVGLLLSLLPSLLVAAQAEPGVAFPHVEVDRAANQVRVGAEMVVLDAPLEFVCVVSGTADHETVIRTAARPSHIHAGLLLLGLEPGEPIRWSEAAETFLPPSGPPIRVMISWQEDGQTITRPVESLIRRIDSGEVMPPRTWVFTGSRLGPRGEYAADLTGQVVSLVNFESSMIDVPALVSDSNETLEWELNKPAAPPAGTLVTMILEPVGDAPATRPAAEETAAESDDELAELRATWRAAVLPRQDDLRTAAETHYAVIADLRARQQTLITEVDKLQRLIDELEREYQDLTTPRPARDEE
jgi:hypothetical protein